MAKLIKGDQRNQQRIENVERCFGAAGTPLLQEGRILIGEGVLNKCSKRGQFIKRHFFLFNDILVYGTILINKKRYNQQRIIPLEGITIEKMEDYEGTAQINGWTIRSELKSFNVYAATANERTEWMNHINACIKELKQNPKTLNLSSELAPVWQPDSTTNICQVCRLVQFSLIRRRHHCRKCGRVVCGDCSPHTFLLPAISSNPSRVCTPCFNALKDRGDSMLTSTPQPPLPQGASGLVRPATELQPGEGETKNDSFDDDSEEEGQAAQSLEVDTTFNSFSQLSVSNGAEGGQQLPGETPKPPPRKK